MTDRLTDDQWRMYQMQGYLPLGRMVDDAELAALQREMDDIMLGKAAVDYDNMMMQLDSATGAYNDAGPQSLGHKGATLNYRKIEGLEFDPIFLRYMQKPLFADICRRTYGDATAVRCFRAMFMNKPAKRGTLLPWHQDRWNFIDRDPQITLWLALDPATKANGCVQIIPGSHHTLFNPAHNSGFLTDEQASLIDDGKAVDMELAPGECVLLHNWTLHRSDVNRTDIPRRAFSVCYMHGDTKANDPASEAKWSLIFGDGALDPDRLATSRA